MARAKTLWGEFVKKPRNAARAIQFHASPGKNAEIYFRLYMAQADAAKKVLRELAAKYGMSVVRLALS